MSNNALNPRIQYIKAVFRSLTWVALSLLASNLLPAQSPMSRSYGSDFIKKTRIEFPDKIKLQNLLQEDITALQLIDSSKQGIKTELWEWNTNGNFLHYECDWDKGRAFEKITCEYKNGKWVKWLFEGTTPEGIHKQSDTLIYKDGLLYRSYSIRYPSSQSIFEYDENDSLVATFSVNSSFDSRNRKQLHYDSLGRLCKVVSGLENTTYTYDQAGRLRKAQTTENWADKNEDPDYFTSHEAIYNYDAQDRLVEVRISMPGWHFYHDTYTYDAENRMLQNVFEESKEHQWGEEDRTWFAEIGLEDDPPWSKTTRSYQYADGLQIVNVRVESGTKEQAVISNFSLHTTYSKNGLREDWKKLVAEQEQPVRWGYSTTSQQGFPLLHFRTDTAGNARMIRYKYITTK